MKNLILLVILFLLGCTPHADQVTESEVMRTLEGFLEAIDVENDDPDMLDYYVTDDLLIFEGGKKMTKVEFQKYTTDFAISQSDWAISDINISTDVNSAHISMFNTGTFIMLKDGVSVKQKLKWVESAYMVKEENKLKIKFYFSDNVWSETEALE